MSADYWERKALNKCGSPDSLYPPGYVDTREEDKMASVPCRCCKEPVFDPGRCEECERRHEKKAELIEEGRL